MGLFVQKIGNFVGYKIVYYMNSFYITVFPVSLTEKLFLISYILKYLHGNMYYILLQTAKLYASFGWLTAYWFTVTVLRLSHITSVN